MLLNLFTPRHDHPFADLREVKRRIAELPVGNPIRMLEELAHWFASTRAEGFRLEHRAQLALLLDEAGQAAARRVTREYVAASRLSKVQENRWWNAVRDFWREAGLSHFDCLEACEAAEKQSEVPKQSLPLVCVRALRALTAQMKWAHIRYGMLDESLWGMAGRIYSVAEQRRITGARVAMVPGAAAATSPEQELVRMVLFSVCSPDSLLPQEIDAAERLIDALSVHTRVTSVAPPESAYWIDIAASAPPLRHASPPGDVPTVRYVTASPAADGAERLLVAMRHRAGVPSELGLADKYPTDLVRHVLEHLVRHWGPHPPERRHERHRVKARITIAPGFDAALEVLRPDSLAFVGDRSESWIVENVSAGGFGARLTQTPSDWLRVESLVALQPEGGTNWVLGIVRRLSRPRPDKTLVGIQTIARVPQVVHLRLRVGETLSLDTEIAILAAPLRADDRTIQVLVKSGVHALGQSFLLEQDGLTFTLLPRDVAGRGVDYELIDCLVAVREPS